MTQPQPLFRAGEIAETARLALSAAGRDIVVGMTWLEGALGPEWTLDDLLAHVQAGDATLVSKRSGEAVGLVVVLAHEPERGAACLPFAGIDPAERFRGLGGEAVLALERRIEERWGTRRFLAPVPEGRGLAVYFWLRLGYRPLTRKDAPWAPVGLNGKPAPGLWMARDAQVRGGSARGV